jgi:hypothetical protein
MTTKTKIIVFTSVIAILGIGGYLGYNYWKKNKKEKHSNLDESGNLIDPSKDMDGVPVVKPSSTTTNNIIPPTFIPPSSSTNSYVGKNVFAKTDNVKVYLFQYALSNGTPNTTKIYKTAKKGEYIMKPSAQTGGWLNNGHTIVDKNLVTTNP